MFCLRDSKELLSHLEENFNQLSLTIAMKPSKEIFNIMRTVHTMTLKLLQNSALNPSCQSNLLSEFTSMVERLQNKDLKWTTEDLQQECPQNFNRMIQEVKRALGTDVALSSMKNHPAYVQIQVHQFQASATLHLSNQPKASDSQIRNFYVNNLLHANYKKFAQSFCFNQNSAVLLFRNSNRGDENEFVISCLFPHFEKKILSSSNLYCYFHEATCTWGTSKSTPGFYSHFMSFINSEFTEFARRSLGNNNLVFIPIDTNFSLAETRALIEELKRQIKSTKEQNPQ